MALDIQARLNAMRSGDLQTRINAMRNAGSLELPTPQTAESTSGLDLPSPATRTYWNGTTRQRQDRGALLAAVNTSKSAANTPNAANDFSLGKLALGGIRKGVTTAGRGISSTAAWLESALFAPVEALTGFDDLQEQHGIFYKLNEQTKKEAENVEKQSAENREKGGTAAKVAESVIAGTTAAVPQAITAFLSAGSSVLGQAGLEATAIAAQQSPTLLNTLRGAIAGMANNPNYWTSFLQTAGNSYEEAKEDGASDVKASLYALSNGLFNAAIEVGGGIETLPNDLKGGKATFKRWLQGAAEEGNEEIWQGIVERGLQNLTYGKKNPVASVTDENAVINPLTSLKEFGMGAAVGGILGGGQIGLDSAINARRGLDLPTVKSTQEAQSLDLQTPQSTQEAQSLDLPTVNAEPETAANSQTFGNLEDVGRDVQATEENDLLNDEIRKQKGLPPAGMDIDEYTASLEAKANKAKQERLSEKSREDYVGSPSLDRLGVQIAESVGEYGITDQLIAQSKAAKKTKRAIANAEKRLKPRPAEKDFANGIAAGLYTLDDIPKSMSYGVVSELADYYTARNAANEKLLGRVKKRIYQNIEEKFDSIFDNVIPVARKRPTALTLNYRTAQRNMRAIFGDQTGDQINKYLFDPVDANESERIRFVNKQFDAVRNFKDSKGLSRRLTDSEKQVTQMILEGVNPSEIVAGVEIMTALENAAIAAGQDSAQSAAPYIARWQKAAQQLQSGEADLTIVNHAVEAYRSLYSQYYDAINDFLVAHGYEPIGWRKNYAPHMQPQETKSALQTALNGLGINTEVTNLPTDIAGLTAAYRPNKRFDPHFLERQGHLTDFDVEKGFSEYVDYMSDVLYHTDDIMKLRRFSDYIRMAFTREKVGNELHDLMQSRYTADPATKLEILRANDAIDKDTVLSDADAEQRFDRYVSDELERYGTNYGDFVTWLDNYTNILAGKQSFADRGAESIAGRKLLNAGRRMISTFSNSKVAGNLSSTLNQTAQFPFILSEIGAKNTIQAIRDMAGKGHLGYFKTQSDFLTGKRGIDYLVQTDGQKIMNVLFTPVSVVDEALGTIAVRGKYLQALDAGETADEAMRLADRYGKEVMASRLKGSRPVAFNTKNPIHQAINIFQLEALNSWEHLTQDKLGRDLREVENAKGKRAAAAQAGAYLAKTVMSAFILNRIAEAVYGGTPAAFDLLGLVLSGLASGEGEAPNDWLMEVLDNGWDKLFGERIFNTEPDGEKEFDYKEAAKDFAYNLSNDIPFLRNISGVLGLGDQTLPIPNVAGGLRDIASSAADNGVFSGDTAKAAGSLASEVLPVGGQAKKTGLGIEYLARGGEFSGYGENARLKYPADDRWSEAVKAVLFGKNTTTAAKRYYASGNAALSAKQTKAWKALKADGADPLQLYNLIQDYREIGSDKDLSSVDRGIYQRELIRNSDLTDSQKLTLYSSLTDSESRSEKFMRMHKDGMSFDQITDFYDKWANVETSKKGTEETKAKYDLLLNLNFSDNALQATYKAFYNGSQKDVNQLVAHGASIRNLIQYKAQTADLTADKDSDGKTVSGSLKAKEMAIIDAMQLSDEAKDALYLATGHTESTLEDAPWHESPLSKLSLPGVSRVNLDLPSLKLPDLKLPRM